MGKGRIIAALGGGRYTLEIVEDRARAESSRAMAVQRVAELDQRITDAQAEVEALQQAVDDAALAQDEAIALHQQQIADDGESDVDLAAYAVAVMEAAANRDRKRIEIGSMQADGLALQTRIERIDALPPLRQIEAWCADHTEDLEGEVATAEVPGEVGEVIIKPGYSDAAAWSPTADGAIQPALSGTPAGVFYNLAMLPGWQMWRPTFRIATIDAIAGDFCDITLIPATSSQQGLGVNFRANYNDVPIMYMDCDGDAFDNGDRVLVAFSGSTEDPIVVGFEKEPKICQGITYFHSGHAMVLDDQLPASIPSTVRVFRGSRDHVPVEDYECSEASPSGTYTWHEAAWEPTSLSSSSVIVTNEGTSRTQVFNLGRNFSYNTTGSLDDLSERNKPSASSTFSLTTNHNNTVDYDATGGLGILESGGQVYIDDTCRPRDDFWYVDRDCTMNADYSCNLEVPGEVLVTRTMSASSYHAGKYLSWGTSAGDDVGFEIPTGSITAGAYSDQLAVHGVTVDLAAVYETMDEWLEDSDENFAWPHMIWNYKANITDESGGEILYRYTVRPLKQLLLEVCGAIINGSRHAFVMVGSEGDSWTVPAAYYFGFFKDDNGNWQRTDVPTWIRWEMAGMSLFPDALRNPDQADDIRHIIVPADVG